MDVRTLKDSTGAVFSPRVSTESVYLKNSTTTLDSKLSSMDTSIDGKMDKDKLATVATSGNYNDLNNKPTSLPSSWLNVNSDLVFGANGLNYFNHHDSGGNSPTANNNPTTDWYHTLRMNHGNSGGYYVDFSVCFHSDVAAFRRIVNGSANGWRYLVSSNSQGGNIYSTGFYVSSLRSLKENIKTSSVNALDLINSQEIVDFNYKADEDKQPKIGLIADDSDPLFLDKKKETVDLYNTCGILMKAVQELSKKVDKLEQQLIDILK